jgi:hypothetical protein
MSVGFYWWLPGFSLPGLNWRCGKDGKKFQPLEKHGQKRERGRAVAMKIGNLKRNALLFMAFYCALLASATGSAETTTTTTTTTNPDGTTTTTVEETTTTGEPETTSQETQPASQPVGRKLVGPAGVTGTIRRADRRQDRRLEEDLDDLEDALEGRPRR